MGILNEVMWNGSGAIIVKLRSKPDIVYERGGAAYWGFW